MDESESRTFCQVDGVNEAKKSTVCTKKPKVSELARSES